jgi:hypothetical protein
VIPRPTTQRTTSHSQKPHYSNQPKSHRSTLTAPTKASLARINEIQNQNLHHSKQLPIPLRYNTTSNIPYSARSSNNRRRESMTLWINR